MATILVAEDDRHINRVVSLWLRRNGHEVISVTNGREALEQLRTHQPDLLVTDVNMPGMDGLDLVAQMRAESLNNHQAIVLTSRCDQAEIEARVSELGAIVHPKPFSPQHLVKAIEIALRTTCIFSTKTNHL